MKDGDPGTLARLAASHRSEDRLRSLRLMRQRIEAGDPPGDYLGLARRLVADADNDCRWQALIVVGELIATDPEAVWQVVREHGVSEDEDMRTGVATVLMGHLLEQHFDLIFPHVKELIDDGSVRMRDTLARCWPFGQAVPRWAEVEALIKSSGR